MEKIIAKGAEALIIRKNSSILKDRIKKSYRLQILDNKLRRQRTKKEARLLQKSSSLIPVPKLLKPLKEDSFSLELEFIKGKKLSDFLDALSNSTEICTSIGKNIAKLHDIGIIHGDLTTSNMILSKDKVYFIDFGLGFESHETEHKAVDLHVLKEALDARHFENAKKFWLSILEGYKSSKFSLSVLKRLEKVSSRGRYKMQY